MWFWEYITNFPQSLGYITTIIPNQKFNSLSPSLSPNFLPIWEEKKIVHPKRRGISPSPFPLLPSYQTKPSKDTLLHLFSLLFHPSKYNIKFFQTFSHHLYIKTYNQIFIFSCGIQHPTFVKISPVCLKLAINSIYKWPTNSESPPFIIYNSRATSFKY